VPFCRAALVADALAGKGRAMPKGVQKSHKEKKKPKKEKVKPAK
jgi:hypothetical protein